MMHFNSFVCAIKTNGKVLREINGEVNLPFGSEYSILLKNLNSCRALASISIDGKDVADGTKFILQPNTDFEIERFLTNGNMNKGNSFKFIERTEAVEKHRGVGAEDGIIRVEFWQEVVHVTIPIPRYEPYPVPIPYPYPCPNNPWPWRRKRFNDAYPWGTTTCNTAPTRSMSKGVRGQSTNTWMKSSSIPNMGSQVSTVNSSETTCFSATDVNDAGITAPGSVSNQSFHYGEYFQTESQSTVITLQLKGGIRGKIVKQAVTVKHKITCVSCGLKNKYPAQFCSRCGTGLELAG